MRDAKQARLAILSLFIATMSCLGQINSDLVCSYPPSTASAWGGEVNTRVNMANGVMGSNQLNDQTGTGANFNIVGYCMSTNDSSGQDNGYVCTEITYGSEYSDLRNYAASVGADQVVFCPYASTGAAGNAGQPGQYSSISSTWWWLVIVAHETGGHNYGRTHNDGMVSPKTIMLHNYCGGGAAWPYFYTDPNIWWNGVQMISTLANDCGNGSLPNGGDNSSYSAQWMQNQVDHIAVGPALNNVVLHWSFTNAPGSAPAGTTNYDLVSSAPAVVRGNGATYTGSALRIPGGTTGNVAMSSISAYIDLPNGIVSSKTNLTIEIWATPLSAPNWARVMDFGSCAGAGDGLGAPGEYTGNVNDPAPGTTTASDDVLLSLANGTNYNAQRFMIGTNGIFTTYDASLSTTLGVQHHYAITFTDGAGTYGTNGGRWQWYRDGYSVAFVDVSYHLSAIHDVNNWLGRSLWSGDSLANNDYAEVRISNAALSPGQVLANYQLGPNYNLPANTVVMKNSDPWGGTSFNAAGQWSNGQAPSAGNNYVTYGYRFLTPNSGANYTFAGNSLAIGPDPAGDIESGLYWGGSSSSTITINNLIMNNARIDNRGSGTFTLAGNLTATNGVVVNAMNAPIKIAANLSGNGSMTYVGNQGTQNGLNTAYQGNKITLAGNNSGFTGQTVIGFGAGAAGGVVIDSEARLGSNPATFTYNQLAMNRGQLTTTATMTLSNANRGILLDVNGGDFDPAAGTTLTIGCQLFSPSLPGGGVTAGNLNKTSPGTLILNSPNSGFNGMLYVDSGYNNFNDGVVQIANNTVMANAHSPIYIRNYGNSSSTLQLNGASGNITLPQTISVNGRSSTTPAIENVAGTNTLSGGISPYGSGNYIVQSDAGVLNLGGAITSSDGGADTITFQGSGAVNLNGSVSGAMSINKTGNGALNFSPGSTYSGSTTVSQGTLALQNPNTPILHLTFDNAAGGGNGTVITNAGSGGAAMNGTMVGSGASIVSGGRYGNALSLNGTGGTALTNLVLINNKCVPTDAVGSWTMGYWIKTSTAGAAILYQGDGTWSSAGQTTYYLNNGSSTGSAAGAVRWAGGWLTGTASLNNNLWHFVAIVDNAGTESIYVDGNADTVTSTMGGSLASAANQIWIGGTPDGGDGAVKMNGLVDEIYMFNRPLSQAEVRSLYVNNRITNAPANVLPVTTPLTVAPGGVLDLAGVSQTVAGLSSGGIVTNSGPAATLTVSNASGATAFGGVITDGSAASAVSFTKSGGGTAILSGANSYRGATVVSGGTLQLAPVANDALLHLTFGNTAGSGNGAVITNTGTGGVAMNGTLVSSGGASIVSGGRFGNALQLNGTGGNASNNIIVINNQVVNTDASGSWSVGYWLKTTTAGAVVMYQGDGSWSSAGQTTFYLNNNGTTSGTHAGAVRWAGGWLTGTANLNNGAWHFVTLVDNGGTESVYVDGNVDAVTSMMVNPLASDANQIWIGGSPDGGDGATKMNGLIDEVWMFNRALSQAEVQSLYTNNNFPANNGNVLPAATSVSVASGAALDLGGVSQTVAALTGSGLVTNSGTTVTLTLATGAGSNIFNGVISDASEGNALSVVQSGTGTTMLSGANTYRGTTTVNGGALLVNGSIGSGAVTVAGGSLGGNGTIGGAITVQSGGTMAPGGGLSRLAVNNDVTLQQGSSTFLEISKSSQTNDQLRVAGALTLSGTLMVTNVSGTLTGGESFQLFSAGSIGGSFSATNLPPLSAGLTWSFNQASGVLSVVQTVATNSTNITFTASSGSLTLSWPSDHTGWRLQSNTNLIGTNWLDVVGSTATNSMILPIDYNSGSLFYRLIYP